MGTIGENKAIARRYVEEVLNQGNLAVAKELVSDSSTDLAQSSLSRAVFLSAFTNTRLSIDRMVAQGDRVAVASTYAATHSGTFLGIKATNKLVMGREIDLFTIKDGKITSAEYNYDLIEIAVQLGLFPEKAVYSPE